MDVFQLKAGRYLLYLDILGFSQLVQTKTPQAVYAIVDSVLGEFQKRSTHIREFRTLYFSDTIIFYQDPVGWGSWAFCDVYALTGLAWSALAAQGIPCRGAISFGEFHVGLDSNGQHSIFFGKALIEAYKTESAEENSEWIGVTLCPSAWQAVEYMEPRTIGSLTSERRFLKVGDALRLNPLIKLRNWYDHSKLESFDWPLHEWDAPDFPNDVKALEFILRTSESYAAKEDYGRIATKYHATAAILRDLLLEDCVAWSRKVYQTFPTVSPPIGS